MPSLFRTGRQFHRHAAPHRMALRILCISRRLSRRHRNLRPHLLLRRTPHPRDRCPNGPWRANTVSLGVSRALTSFLKTELFHVSATDPIAFLTASVVVSAMTIAAAWLPARRATEVDPSSPSVVSSRRSSFQRRGSRTSLYASEHRVRTRTRISREPLL